MEVVNLMKEEMGIGEEIIKRCPICYSPDLHQHDEVVIDHKKEELYVWVICNNCTSLHRQVL